MRHFIRVYTPFLLSLFSLANVIYFVSGTEELLPIYLIANIAGGSVLVDIYMFFHSRRMCVWYKLNILCLFLIHSSGALYNACDINEVVYTNIVAALSVIGIISFLIFRIFYRTTQ